jgi:hypothetical protein
MAGRCANRACSVSRPHSHQGKLFRVDVNVANYKGEQRWKTMYLWLCARCAREMHPKVEVTGDRVQVRLGKIEPALLPSPSPKPCWIN